MSDEVVPTNVFIYGSCVSRDTFEFLPNTFKLTGYVARQSLISAGTTVHVEPDPVRLLDSRFQQRMLAGDLSGNAYERIAATPPETLLLWDLADERLGVFEVAPGRYLTRSVELERSGQAAQLERQYRHVPFGTSEHLNLWLAALDRFAAWLHLTGRMSRMLLVNVPWAVLAEDGRPTPPSFGIEAHDANVCFAEYVNAVRTRTAITVLSIDASAVHADSHHRWGLAPFHYSQGTYEHIATRIIAAARSERRDPSMPAPGDDIRARARSHLFGRHLDPSPSDTSDAARLLAGTLTLPPHAPVPLSRPIDWDADPLSDRNWLFNLHTLRWADVLRRVGSPAHLDMHRDVIAQWTRTYSGTFRKTHSRFAWNDMATGLRTIVLAGAVAAYGPEPWLIDALREHGEILSTPGFGSQTGNHALHVRIGQLVAGHVLGVEQWTTEAGDAIRTFILASVDEEGADSEGSTGYQMANLAWYQEAVRHLAAVGIDPGDASTRLPRMARFLVYSTSPSGRLVPLGDSDTVVPRDFGDTYLTYVRSGGTAGARPPATYALYRKAGYLFSRTGWDSSPESQDRFYSLKFGPARRAQHHGHDDGGSLTFSVGHSTWLRDSGRHKYDRSPLSLYFKSHKAHNSVILDDESYDQDAPTTLLEARTDDHHDWTVVRRTEAQGTTWTRGVYFDRDDPVLLVVDHVQGRANTPFVQHWHVPPASTVVVDEQDRRAVVTEPESIGSLVVTWVGAGQTAADVVVGSRDPYLGWQSLGYGGAVPAPVLRVAHPGGHGVLVTAFLYRANAADLTAVALRTVDDLSGAFCAALWMDGRRLGAVKVTREGEMALDVSRSQ